MSDEIANLKHALAVANNWVEHHQNHCDDLIKENAALRSRCDELEQSRKAERLARVQLQAEREARK